MALYQAELQEVLKYYQGIIEIYNQRLAKAPPGSLNFQKNKSNGQFLHVYSDNGNIIRHGINHDHSLQRALAQKEFMRRALKVLEPNVATLKKAIEGIVPFDVDEILGSMTKGYAKLPEDYFFDRDLLAIDLHLDGEREARIRRHEEWGDREFYQNTKHEEYKRHTTSWGERVRSKSEMLILERIHHFEVQVHYEQVRHIGDVMVAPDFTFEGKNGQPFYWEHIGMLDHDEYARSNYNKLKLYYYAGITPGDNLILSFERHGVLDMGMIDAIIEHEVIPRM